VARQAIEALQCIRLSCGSRKQMSTVSAAAIALFIASMTPEENIGSMNA